MATKSGRSAGLALALAIGAAVAAGGAFAQGGAATDAGVKAAETRHANFKQQGAAFKAINDELKKDTPDKTVIAANATKLATLAAQLPSWFPKGSGPESGAKTHAKAAVWTDAAGFAEAAKRLQTEAPKLQQVAATGDLEAIRAQVRATGGACKACHDKFREEEKH
jgi:cytochrome c556